MGWGGVGTRTYFFTTIMIMSGNGHFQHLGEKGPVTDRRKPNTTGADFTVTRINDILLAWYDRLGIQEKARYYIPVNCMRFTPTAFEQASTATAVGADLMTQPPPDTNDRPMVVTELRSENMEGVLKFVMPRGEKSGSVLSINVCDRAKTGVREMASKVVVNQLALEFLCGNKRDQKEAQVEETRTAMVVSPVFPPGAAVEFKKRSRQQFQDVMHDSNTGRHRPLESTESVTNFLVYTHKTAAFYVGLINRLQTMPCEINQTASAFLEWGTFYLRHYGEGVMDQTVRENFSRIVQGYTTRTLVWFVWLKAIIRLSRVAQGTRPRHVYKDLLLDMAADALPVTGVPVMLTCMMTRSVHMGALLMTMLMADSMLVPVVSWENLNRFFTDDEPPTETGTYMDAYNMIKEWVQRCLAENRFCPADEGEYNAEHNVSCYITDKGTATLGQSPDGDGFLRFAPDFPQGGGGNRGGGSSTQHQQQENSGLYTRIAGRIQKMHGAHLFQLCHMGPERCVYMYAMMWLASHFVPDFRGLGSPHAFCSEKHLRKLGLLRHLPGVKDHTDHKSPKFAREVEFMAEGQVKSVAMGVNMWSLLCIVSLTGEILVHPTVSDRFAKGLVEQILRKAPPGATPGNMCPTRLFDQSTKPIRMFISDKERPAHFLRPTDSSFPTRGTLTLARGVEQFLPEDLLPCPAIPMVASMLGCKIEQVPASAVKVR